MDIISLEEKLLTGDSKITNPKELLKYLFKTDLNLASFVVYYKRF